MARSRSPSEPLLLTSARLARCQSHSGKSTPHLFGCSPRDDGPRARNIGQASSPERLRRSFIEANSPTPKPLLDSLLGAVPPMPAALSSSPPCSVATKVIPKAVWSPRGEFSTFVPQWNRVMESCRSTSSSALPGAANDHQESAAKGSTSPRDTVARPLSAKQLRSGVYRMASAPSGVAEGSSRFCAKLLNVECGKSLATPSTCSGEGADRSATAASARSAMDNNVNGALSPRVLDVAPDERPAGSLARPSPSFIFEPVVRRAVSSARTSPRGAGMKTLLASPVRAAGVISPRATRALSKAQDRSPRHVMRGASAAEERRFGAGGERCNIAKDWEPASEKHCQGLRKSSSHGSFARSPREVWESQRKSHGADSARKVSQALHRSSFLDEQGFYAKASSQQSWEVSELKIKGLPSQATDHSLERICKAFGHQVVRVETGWDPIKDRCNGHAKILIRSGNAASTPELTRFLEDRAGCEVQY